jgi:hypothetical protein
MESIPVDFRAIKILAQFPRSHVASRARALRGIELPPPSKIFIRQRRDLIVLRRRNVVIAR